MPRASPHLSLRATTRREAPVGRRQSGRSYLRCGRPLAFSFRPGRAYPTSTVERSSWRTFTGFFDFAAAPIRQVPCTLNRTNPHQQRQSSACRHRHTPNRPEHSAHRDDRLPHAVVVILLAGDAVWDALIHHLARLAAHSSQVSAEFTNPFVHSQIHKKDATPSPTSPPRSWAYTQAKI